MQLNRRHILYVEDHEDTCELITLVLQQKNFEVTTERTIEKGAQLAREQNFDLYLLDSWLADGSGLDLCKRIREFDRITPIIFYSAAAYEADRDMALNSGAQAYLIKPSHTWELCDLICSLIEHGGNGHDKTYGNFLTVGE
jgi:DNA-binding response OmpR family regulator